MAVFTVHANFGTTVRVDYLDPAGGFGGWFIHTINDVGFVPVSNSTDAGALATLMAGSPPGNSTQAALHASIKARLTHLFGTDASVTWTVTLLESVTPAVIDDNF